MSLIHPHLSKNSLSPKLIALGINPEFCIFSLILDVTAIIKYQQPRPVGLHLLAMVIKILAFGKINLFHQLGHIS